MSFQGEDDMEEDAEDDVIQQAGLVCLLEPKDRKRGCMHMLLDSIWAL